MYLVFDIGGTNMRIGVSADGETISQSKVISTPKDFEQGIQTLKQIADVLSGEQKIASLAGGVAGPLDKEKTMLLASPHISGWIKKPLKVELEKIFNASVLLENDTALGGLGEATKGAGVGKNIVAYLAVGTGVGGVRVVNGKIDTNSLGFEPGHQIVVIDGSPCNCGGRGHLESYISGSGIERIYGKKAAEIKDIQTWDKIARHLAIGLNNTIVHWSPDMVVLGGAVSASIPLTKVQVYLHQALTIFPTLPPIVKAQLEDSAGLFGALQILKHV